MIKEIPTKDLPDIVIYTNRHWQLPDSAYGQRVSEPGRFEVWKFARGKGSAHRNAHATLAIMHFNYQDSDASDVLYREYPGRQLRSRAQELAQIADFLKWATQYIAVYTALVVERWSFPLVENGEIVQGRRGEAAYGIRVSGRLLPEYKIGWQFTTVLRPKQLIGNPEEMQAVIEAAKVNYGITLKDARERALRDG
jgi:hypothetical protein